MSLVQDWEDLKPSGAGVFVPLVIATLGTLLIIVLFFLLPGFQTIEMLALLLGVAIAALGYSRCIVRGLTSYLILYVSSGIAASLYQSTTPYVARLLNSLAHPFSARPVVAPTLTRGDYAFTFALLTVSVWGLLELLTKAVMPDAGIPKLRIADNIAGVLIHLLVAALAATLFFNTLGYGGLRYAHNRAQFRDAFNRVLLVHYQTQSFWFSDDPPPILVYDLDY
jgi:hypothetical protein